MPEHPETSILVAGVKPALGDFENSISATLPKSLKK